MFLDGATDRLQQGGAVQWLFNEIVGAEPHGFDGLLDRAVPGDDDDFDRRTNFLGPLQHLDTLEVRVEVDERLFSDEVKVLQKLAKRIEKEIKDMLGVTCSAKLVEPKTIQRSEGKAIRVIDNRHL